VTWSKNEWGYTSTYPQVFISCTEKNLLFFHYMFDQSACVSKRGELWSVMGNGYNKKTTTDLRHRLLVDI